MRTSDATSDGQTIEMTVRVAGEREKRKCGRSEGTAGC